MSRDYMGKSEFEDEALDALENEPVFICSQFKAGDVLTEEDVAAIQSLLSELDKLEDADTDTFHRGRECGIREVGGDDLWQAVEKKEEAFITKTVREAIAKMDARTTEIKAATLPEPDPAPVSNVLASRHNDKTGKCEPVEMGPVKVRELREKMAAPRDWNSAVIGQPSDLSPVGQRTGLNWENPNDPIVKVFVGFDVEGYVEEYEFCGEGGDYSPNEQERTLLVDAIYGVIANLHEELRKLIPSSPAPRPDVEGRE